MKKEISIVYRESALFFCIILIAVGALFYVSFALKNTSPGLFDFSPPVISMEIGGARLMLEMAATPQKQRQGLSGRTGLSRDAGMIFPISPAGKPAFWMKNMNFPLDVIYVRNSRVVEIKEDIQPSAMAMPFYSNETADAVIEVNAGFVKANNIKVGDTVAVSQS